MSKLNLDEMFENVINRIDFNNESIAQFKYDLYKNDPNDNRIVEYERIVQNNYKTIAELTEVKNRYIKEYEKGNKPCVSTVYYKNKPYIFTTSSNDEYTNLPIEIMYYLDNHLPNNDNSINYINGLYISEIEYIDYMRLASLNMINYLRLDIGNIIVKMEDQINKLPSNIKGLITKNFISSPNIMDDINNKHSLEYLDITFASLDEFNYVHEHLKTLILKKCTYLKSIDTNSKLELIDISGTGINPEYLKKFPSLKTIRMYREETNLNYINKTNNIINTMVLSPYNNLNSIIYTDPSLKIELDQIKELNITNHGYGDLSKEIKANLWIDIMIDIDAKNIDSYNTHKAINNKTFDPILDNQYMFKNLPSIEKLNLKMINNNIHTKETFDNMPNIKSLHINSGRIEEGSLDNCKSIKTLEIVLHNGPLPVNLISNLKNLTQIEIMSCTIPKGFFKEAQSLKCISLYGCTILDDNPFEYLTNVEEITLSCNIKISNKLIGHFKLLKSLETVWVKNLDLDFKLFPNLNSLKLYFGNDIDIIPNNIFTGLNNLIYLSLRSYTSNKPIINTLAFNNLLNLKKIIFNGFNIVRNNINCSLFYVELESCIYDDTLIENLKNIPTLIRIEKQGSGYREILYNKN